MWKRREDNSTVIENQLKNTTQRKMGFVSSDDRHEHSFSNAASIGTGSIVGGITLLIVIITCLKLRKRKKEERPFGGGRQVIEVKVDGEDNAYEDVNTSPPQTLPVFRHQNEEVHTSPPKRLPVYRHQYEDIDLDEPRVSTEGGKGHLNTRTTVDSTVDRAGHNDNKITVSDPKDHQYTEVVKKW